MRSASLDPVVHLELHTGNGARASDFYTGLFGWHAETVEVPHCAYLSSRAKARSDGGAFLPSLPAPGLRFWQPKV